MKSSCSSSGPGGCAPASQATACDPCGRGGRTPRFQRLKRRLSAAGLSAASGVLMAMAFIPFDWGFFAWVALLPVLSVLWGSRVRGFWSCFGYGWIFGLAFFGTSLAWLLSVGDLFEVPRALFFGGVYVPFMGYLALYPALWAGITGKWLRPVRKAAPEAAALPPAERRLLWNAWARQDILYGLLACLGTAAAWVVTEWLRGTLLTGFAWNGLGTALYNGLSLAQWAEYVGVTALAFIPVLANAVFWRAGSRVGIMVMREGRRGMPWDFYALAAAVFALFLGGMLLSRHYAPEVQLRAPGTLKLPVLAVQANIPQAERFRMEPGEAYYRVLRQTARGLEEAQRADFARAMQTGQNIFRSVPAWVVWPESSLGAPLLIEQATNAVLSDAYNSNLLFGEQALPSLRQKYALPDGSSFVLLTGADVLGLRTAATGEWERENNRNSLAVFEQGLSSLKRADKRHLVPFGEYIPLQRQLPMLAEIYASMAGAAMGSGMIPGECSRPLAVAVPGTQETVGVIPAVCYEDSVGSLLREFARPGPQVIVNITNDGWFLTSCANEQQARQAAFRCIELRRPMIRAANTGLTVAFGANGAVIRELRGDTGSPFVEGALFTVLPVDRRAGLTLYAIAGDWAVGVCALLALACCWFNCRIRRLVGRG